MPRWLAKAKLAKPSHKFSNHFAQKAEPCHFATHLKQLAPCCAGWQTLPSPIFQSPAEQQQLGREWRADRARKQTKRSVSQTALPPTPARNLIPSALTPGALGTQHHKWLRTLHPPQKLTSTTENNQFPALAAKGVACDTGAHVGWRKTLERKPRHGSDIALLPRHVPAVHTPSGGRRTNSTSFLRVERETEPTL